ncbi:MAG: HGGxSTG domain-containing protein [Novosphingobium sp.]
MIGVDEQMRSTAQVPHAIHGNPNNPMQPEVLAAAPRCGARTRSGTPCMSPVVRGKRRCRMHGGTSKGAPKGNRNAWKHGDRSAESERLLKVVHGAGRILKMVNRVKAGAELSASEHDLLLQLKLERTLLPGSERSED